MSVTITLGILLSMTTLGVACSAPTITARQRSAGALRERGMTHAGAWGAAALWSTPARAEEEEAPDLRGHWRMDLRVVSHADIPVLGTATVLSHSIFKVLIDGTAQTQVQHTEPCYLKAYPERAIARTIIPRTFVDALPNKTFPLTLEPDAEGWRLQADMLPQYIGYTPDGADDGVPLEPDDPRVEDTDDDGRPGATIRLNLPLFDDVALYTAQRAQTLLDGHLSGVDRVSGGVNIAGFQQRTLSASNRLFVSNPNIEIDQGRSTFEMVRLPGETPCDELTP